MALDIYGVWQVAPQTFILGTLHPQFKISSKLLRLTKPAPRHATPRHANAEIAHSSNHRRPRSPMLPSLEPQHEIVDDPPPSATPLIASKSHLVQKDVILVKKKNVVRVVERRKKKKRKEKCFRRGERGEESKYPRSVT